MQTQSNNIINIDQIADIAIDAGRAIMAVRNRDFNKTMKPDGSPVTEADLAADEIINASLGLLTPDITRITEETWEDDQDQSEPPQYWCVDPLDGTKGFINGGRDFTVNIGLIDNRYPVMGVIYAPALGRIWAGHGDDAWMCDAVADIPKTLADFTPKTALKARPIQEQHPVIVATKAHRGPALESWISQLDAASSSAVGSSLKFCHLAMGSADLYPRIGPTMEWDTAAGQAILEAAGGTMIGIDGQRFAYGKAGRLNTPFAAMGAVETIPSSWYPPAVHS